MVSYGLLTDTAKILSVETMEDIVTVLKIARRRVLTQPSGMQADASCIDVRACLNNLIVIHIYSAWTGQRSSRNLK